MTARRCKLARRLAPYLDAELDLDATLEFEEHLDECAGCRAGVRSQRALEEALVALPRPPLLLPDRARLRAAIGAAIDAPSGLERPVERSFPLRRVAAALFAIAATLALAFLWHPATDARSDSPSAVVAVAPPIETADPLQPLAPPVVLSPEGIDSLSLPLPLLAAARDEVATILRQMSQHYSAIASSDPLTNFVAATQPLRAVGIPITTVMVALLRDPDPELAVRAADLIARAAADGGLGRDEGALVPALEQVMRRPDRGAAMAATLGAIGTPRARLALMTALDMDHARAIATRELLAQPDAEGFTSLTRRLVAMAADDAGRALIGEALAALVIDEPAHLRLLAELRRAGVSASPIAAALQRRRHDCLPLFSAALTKSSAPLRRDALELVPLLQEPSLAPAIAELARRSSDGALVSAALAALRELSGAAPLAALTALAADPTLGRTRGAELAAAFDAVLARTQDVAAALAAVRAEVPESDGLLAALCSGASGHAGAAARRELVLDPSLAPSARRMAALAAARRGETIDVERLAACLTPLRSGDGDTEKTALTGALFVLLHQSDGESGIDRGLSALALRLSPRSRRQLCDAAAHALTVSDRSRDLARVGQMVAVAP